MTETIDIRNVSEALDFARPDVRILSLDCFDTLLWRLGNAPRDVFADLGGTGMIERRMRAEHHAREASGSASEAGEVTIAQIYNNLLPNADEAARKAAIEREWQAEGRHCYAFAPTVDLIRKAHARGLKIIIVSDTYFSADQLHRLIAQAVGADVAAMIDRVFASSDFGRGKSAGLFGLVLPELGIAPQSILHIGDNLHADGVAPALLGVQTLHLRQFDEDSETKLRLETVAATMIDPSTRSTEPAWQPHRPRVATNADRDPAWVLGHDVLGPVFETFVHWLRDEAAALEAEHGAPVRPIFLLRDGHLPHAVATTLGWSGISTATVSRFTARRASFRDADAIARYIDNEQHERLEVHLEQLLLTARDLPSPAADRAALRMAVLSADVVEKIVSRSAAFAQRLVRHVTTQSGAAPGDTLMLVDLGYAGTVQDKVESVLRNAFGGHVAGRYLLLREFDETGFDKRGLFDTSHYDFRALHALCAPIAVVEQLATTAQGSVTDYRPDGSPIHGKADAGREQARMRARVQDGVVAFARAGSVAYLNEPAVTADMSRRAAMGCLARLLYLPRPAEIDLLERFAHDVNLGTNDTNQLIDRNRSAIDLRRNGPGYLDRSPRLFAAGELQEHGLDLSLTAFGIGRFSFDLRQADLQSGGIDVDVVIADASEQMLATLTAWPTRDGFYRLSVPIGMRQAMIGVMCGKIAPFVEIEAVTSKPITRLADCLWDGQRDVADAATDLDGLRPLGGGLHACDAAGMLLVHPATDTQTSRVVDVVFRPIGGAGVARDVRLAA
ncbi:MAG: hydrolase [Sphingomonadales bacterium]